VEKIPLENILKETGFSLDFMNIKIMKLLVDQKDLKNNYKD